MAMFRKSLSFQGPGQRVQAKESEQQVNIVVKTKEKVSLFKFKGNKPKQYGHT